MKLQTPLLALLLALPLSAASLPHVVATDDLGTPGKQPHLLSGAPWTWTHPVKLRGINRHAAHPLRGRSLPGGQWCKDVELFRDANINLIHTCHWTAYPPDHIGRLEGTALAHPPKALEATEIGPRQDPVSAAKRGASLRLASQNLSDGQQAGGLRHMLPWSSDHTPYGSNDLRVASSPSKSTPPRRQIPAPATNSSCACSLNPPPTRSRASANTQPIKSAASCAASPFSACRKCIFPSSSSAPTSTTISKTQCCGSIWKSTPTPPKARAT